MHLMSQLMDYHVVSQCIKRLDDIAVAARLASGGVAND